GVLSNPITLPSITTWPYGLAFSPSGQRLYISTEGSNELSQWDLSSNNAATINASRTLIANITTMGTLGALQLAPDGKIYLAGNSTADLCVINNPDALGAACNLSINSVNLGGRFSYWGLPNFCTDYINFLTILANGNCFGDSTYFSLADTAGLISVSWNFRDSITGANNFSTSFTPAHVFSLASNFTVMVTATYTTGTFTGYLTVSIVQCSSVVAGFQADTTLCVGSCTDFTNQSVNGLTYTWSFPGAATTTSTDTDPTGICYNLAGTYDVSLIAHNGLQSDTLTLPGYIHVYAPPTAPILINQNDTLYLTQDYDSYQWYFMGAPIVGATDSFFVVTQDGLYSVQLTDANGCTFFSRTSDIAVGTSEIEGIHGGLQVFANESELIIRYQTDRTLELTFSIYDAAGRLVHTSREQTQAGANTLRLQGLQLAKGLYVLHVSDGKNILVQKFAER
ncbi:MAG: T9SS type A sorting domain-containing protein, partial [Bacteroidia bacterium]|nr:T9SS type A sorting domain-containing protein [Bacteroidia bacterium]